MVKLIAQVIVDVKPAPVPHNYPSNIPSVHTIPTSVMVKNVSPPVKRRPVNRVLLRVLLRVLIRVLLRVVQRVTLVMPIM